MSRTPNLLSRSRDLVTAVHRGRKRRYTNEPHIEHCENVAVILVKHGLKDCEVFAASVLHDVLEYADVTEADLRKEFGDRVTQLVLEVTAPVVEGDRAERKQAAREHLARSSPVGASIKLADMIDNLTYFKERDPDSARVYLLEQEALLDVLRHGQPEVWQEAHELLMEAQRGMVHYRLGEGA